MTRHTLFLSLAMSAISLVISAGEVTNAQPDLPSAPPELQLKTTDLSCFELDDRLTRLTPKTYSEAPEFYSDPRNGAAVWVGTLWTPAWAYLGYAGLRQEYRESRMAAAHAEMDQLRQLKARRHCYER